MEKRRSFVLKVFAFIVLNLLLFSLASCMLLFGITYTFINNSSEEILVQPNYYTTSWSSFYLDIGETETIRVGLTEAFSFQHQGLYTANYIPYTESGNTITFF